jgi:hypothetical protein
MAKSIHPWLLRRQAAKLQALVREYDRRVLRLDQLSKARSYAGRADARTAESQALHQCAADITEQWFVAHGFRVRKTG